MCLAIPGKIIEIEKDKAIVDYGKEKREGRIMSNEFKVDDYVIVQAGIVIQKVPENEALEGIRLFQNES